MIARALPIGEAVLRWLRHNWGKFGHIRSLLHFASLSRAENSIIIFRGDARRHGRLFRHHGVAQRLHEADELPIPPFQDLISDSIAQNLGSSVAYGQTSYIPHATL